MNNRPTSIPPARARKSVLLLAGMVGLAAVALVVVASLRHTKSKAQSDAIAVADNPVSETPIAQPVPEPSLPPVAPTPVAAAVPEPDPTAKARELIKSLSEVNLEPGQLTPEKAAQWQRDLEQLVEQGTAAVQPLREFFESRAEVRFDSGPGTNLLQEPSLRIAFLEVLFNIPAPDNVDLQEEVLRVTNDPAEVALLARQLEAQEPGKDRDLIISTAKISLAQARAGMWPGRDPNALVKILKQFGEESVR